LFDRPGRLVFFALCLIVLIGFWHLRGRFLEARRLDFRGMLWISRLS